MDEDGHLQALAPLDRAWALVACEYAAARARGDKQCASYLLVACQAINKAARQEAGQPERKPKNRGGGSHGPNPNLYTDLCKALRSRTGQWFTRWSLNRIMLDGHMNVSIGTGTSPGNYASGGLFNLNPVSVLNTDGVKQRVFSFATEAAP